MQTIFRYPGGKSRVSAKIAELFPSSVTHFMEPFAGGASVSLHMLKATHVSHLLLCDRNPRIATFWSALTNASERLELIDRVLTFKPTVDAYNELKHEQSAFAVLAINRLSHSGRGGGPIGGARQHGAWKIDARWNPTKLAALLAEYGELMRDRVTVLCEDGVGLLLKHKTYYAYVDPPYVSAGPSLYELSFSMEDHHRLCDALRQRDKWVLSYDDHELVRNLYAGFDVDTLMLNVNAAHHAGGSKKKPELIIAARDNQ